MAEKYRAAKPPKPCNGKNNELSAGVGVCMFQYECLQLNGEPIGYCFNSYLVGTCCLLPEKLRLPILQQHKQHSSSSSLPVSSSPNSVNLVTVNTTSSTLPLEWLNKTLPSTNTTNNKVLVISHFVPNNNGQLDLDDDEKKTANGSDLNKFVTKSPQYSSTVASNAIIKINSTVSSPTLVISPQSSVQKIFSTVSSLPEKISLTPSNEFEFDSKFSPSLSTEKPNLVSEWIVTTIKSSTDQVSHTTNTSVVLISKPESISESSTNASQSFASLPTAGVSEEPETKVISSSTVPQMNYSLPVIPSDGASISSSSTESYKSSTSETIVIDCSN